MAQEKLDLAVFWHPLDIARAVTDIDNEEASCTTCPWSFPLSLVATLSKLNNQPFGMPLSFHTSSRALSCKILILCFQVKRADGLRNLSKYPLVVIQSARKQTADTHHHRSLFRENQYVRTNNFAQHHRSGGHSHRK